MKFLKEIYSKFFSLNLNDYANIGVNLEINKLLFFVFLGLCVACFIINYNQSVVALILKKLLRAEAHSEENAKTLSDLGLKESKTAKRLILKNSGSISRIISVCGIKKLTYEEYIEAEKQRKLQKKNKNKISKNKEEGDSSNLSGANIENDVLSAKLYIPEDKKELAIRTYTNNSSSVIKTALYCVLLFAFYLALAFTMPSLLDAVNSILG